MKKVMAVYGTRPEGIKMAPLVHRLRRTSGFEAVVVTTGQHREMLDQVNVLFGITPDHDLHLMRPGATLLSLASRALAALEPVLEAEKPDAVVVQGDTTSAFIAGLAAFYSGTPLVHLEAGLRTGDIHSPFPEEGNRKLISPIAQLHLAPTPLSRDNLLREGLPTRDIVVTGNTVIDALHTALASRPGASTVAGLDEVLHSQRDVMLVTLHRRESWGLPMQRIVAALRAVANAYPDLHIVLPMHRNRIVRDDITGGLTGVPNVLLTEPLDYPDFVRVMARSRLILTDSGGVQEEAPSLGVPVLVARDTTERPEAVEAGTVRLVGTDTLVIVDWITRILDDESVHAEFAHAVNPYGDGRASERSVAAIGAMLGIGERLADFDPWLDRALQPAV